LVQKGGTEGRKGERGDGPRTQDYFTDRESFRERENRAKEKKTDAVDGRLTYGRESRKGRFDNRNIRKLTNFNNDAKKSRASREQKCL